MTRRKKQLVGVTFSSFLLTSAIFGYAVFVNADRMMEDEVQEQSVLLHGGVDHTVKGLGMTVGTSDSVSVDVGYKHFLLIGLDTRDGDLKGRADALVVATIDNNAKTLSLLSIPRDSYVDIVGHGTKDKINHSYAFGGLDMTTKTVEKLFDIKFDDYMVFNFNGFVGVVDALGGVEVDVPFDFTEQDSNDNKHAISLKQGVHTLSGEEALAYARMRKQDATGDMGRVNRQKELVDSLLTKLKDQQGVTTYIKLLANVGTSIDTSVGLTSIPELLSLANGITDTTTRTLRTDGVMIDGIYYGKVDETDLEDIKQQLKLEEATHE